MRVEKLELSWINTVKAICMFTVFLNHSEYYYGYETPVIGPIYRPLFVNSFFFCGSVVNVFALLARHLLIDDYGWIVWLIAGASFLFSSMCVYVIDKWVPFVYDLRKLKRSSLSIDKL